MSNLDSLTIQHGTYALSHIRYLEAESIHVLREVAAEFERPVLLYSIGKDSSVLLRLAQKAFHPGKIPFPLMHVDTDRKSTRLNSSHITISYAVFCLKKKKQNKNNNNLYN